MKKLVGSYGYFKFSGDIAAKYDVDIAIFLENIFFWTKQNAANKRHFHDGFYWTYNSMKAFSELFPFYSEKQIRTIITKCLNQNLIIKNNYNKNKNDRTLWYALTNIGLSLFNIEQKEICQDSQIHSTKRANGNDEMDECIYTDEQPDVLTSSKAYRSSDDDPDTDEGFDSSVSDQKQTKTKIDWKEGFDDFWAIYPRKVARKKAMQAWVNNKCRNHLADILHDIPKRIEMEWRHKEKEFIPHASTYLNQERWNDEITPSFKKQSGTVTSRFMENIKKQRQEIEQAEEAMKCRNQSSMQGKSQDMKQEVNKSLTTDVKGNFNESHIEIHEQQSESNKQSQPLRQQLQPSSTTYQPATTYEEWEANRRKYEEQQRQLQQGIANVFGW